MKNCSQCNQIKLFTDFSPDKRVPSGCQSRCKSCMSENMRKKYAENPEHFKKLVSESVKRNYEKKLQRNNLYRLNNPKKVSSWKRKDRSLNKVRILADNAMRRAKMASPITPEIKQIYALRDFYCAMSLDGDFHVDHLIPLSKGGKHHHDNLRVIPAIDNLKKGAKNAKQESK